MVANTVLNAYLINQLPTSLGDEMLIGFPDMIMNTKNHCELAPLLFQHYLGCCFFYSNFSFSNSDYNLKWRILIIFSQNIQTRYYSFSFSAI